MGTWGVKINENDEYYDTIDLCQDLKMEGYTFSQIEEKILLVKANIANTIERINSLLALADYLWKNNSLSSKLLALLKDIDYEGIEKADWIESGLTEDQYHERKRAIRCFLDDIEKPTTQRIENAQEKNTISIYKKGVLFWYKSKKKIFGGVVLDLITEYDLVLIALSEEIFVVGKINSENILNSKLYTVAWFSSNDLLSSKRIHIIDYVTVDQSYVGYCGLSIDADGSISISNCGSMDTWNHTRYNIRLIDRTMKSVIVKNQLPKVINRSF